MNLLLVLAAALAGGWLARRVGFPSILGELASGILLGPPLLGILSTDDAISVIGKLGVVLLMLYIGLHLDPTSLGKAAKPGLYAAIGGFLVPAALGFGLMMAIEGDAIAAAFVAVAMGVTSLATKSRILVDLGILHTRVAHVLMAGALFSDIAALVLFAALLGLAATGTIALTGILATVGKAALFLAGAWIVGTVLFPRLAAPIARRKMDPSTLFMLVVGVGFSFAAAAEAAGLHEILGAFLAGLFIRDGVLTHSQHAAVETRARNVSVGLLAPVFFVTAGFKVSFDVFSDSLPLVIAVVVLATVGKILGSALFYLPTGFGFREGIAVGAGMNGRGAVEIIVAEIALSAGIIDERVFSLLVFMAVFTTATVPVLLTMSIDWLRRRGELVADERNGVLFIGAGPVALRIASTLARHTDVTLIDANADHGRAAARLGLRMVKGNGLDEEVMEMAAATKAKYLVALTPNAEVNLLSAQLARSRFGIPSIHVAMPEEATGSMLTMMDDIEAKLLFGRKVDLNEWDFAVSRDNVVELTYELGDPENALDEPLHASLPLTVESDSSAEVFAADRPASNGERVVAIAMLPDTTNTSDHDAVIQNLPLPW